MENFVKYFTNNNNSTTATTATSAGNNMGNTPPISTTRAAGDDEGGKDEFASSSSPTIKQQQQQQQQHQQQQENNNINNNNNILASPRITQLRDRKRLIENEIIESKVWLNNNMNIHDDDDDDGNEEKQTETEEVTTTRSSSSTSPKTIKSYEFVSDDLKRIEYDTKVLNQKMKKKKRGQGSSNDTPETEATTTAIDDDNDVELLDTIYQTFLKDAQEEANNYDDDNMVLGHSKNKKTKTTDNYRCFVVVLHESYGMLLLHYTKHPTKDPHYQLPGGKIKESDFYDDEFVRNVTTTLASSINSSSNDNSNQVCGISWPKQLYLAARIACTRYLHEQTGLNFDSNKLLPLIVQQQKQNQKQKQSNDNIDIIDSDDNSILLLRNEYKQRLFFILQINDDDFYKEETYSAARNLDDCPLARLKLSEQHSGFRFESDPKRSVAFLKHFSGGRVTKTLWELIKRAEKEKRTTTAHNHNESTTSSSSTAVPPTSSAVPVTPASPPSAPDAAAAEEEHDDDMDQEQDLNDGISGRKYDENSVDAIASNTISLDTYLTKEGNGKTNNNNVVSGDYNDNNINNDDDALTVVTTGYERLLKDAKQNVDWSFLQQYTGPFGPDVPFEEEPEDENQPPPPPPQPLEEPGKIYYGGYVFVLHDQHGMMLLQRRGKLRQPPHYQIPGGRVDEIDFQQYKYGSWVAQCYLACRAACVRELHDATGLQIKPGRLQPVTFSCKQEQQEGTNGDSSIHIREDEDGEMLLMNEYEERLFYVVTVTDEDFQQEGTNKNDDRLMRFISKSQNDDCSLFLKLPSTYKGFSFEKNSLRAIELLENQGGGKVFEALWMALQQKQPDLQQPLR